MSKRILIADDDENTLIIFNKILTNKGYEVITAISANEALKYCNEEFDIAIIDGFEGDYTKVYEGLKNVERKVVCSGNRECIKDCNKKGWIAYEKPVGLSTLLEE